MGMRNHHALQMEMTEWIYGLNEAKKTDILSYLCAHVPNAVKDAKTTYEWMWARAAGQEEDKEQD